MPNQAQIHAKYWTYVLLCLYDSHLKRVHNQHDGVCCSIKLKNTFLSSGMMYKSSFPKFVSWFKIARYRGGGDCGGGGGERTETDGHTEMMIP